jgi:excisionase family DNA binding protein
MPSASTTMPLPRRLLTTMEAAQFLKCAKNTLEQWRLSGSPIPYVRLGTAVRYDVLDLEAYLAANKQRSTSESGPRRPDLWRKSPQTLEAA